MNPIIRVFRITLLLFILQSFHFELSAQQLADEIHSKVAESDQKKLDKTDDLNTKADLLLSEAGYPGDEQLLNTTEPDSKQNKKYYSKRADAGKYYKESNSIKYQIYEKYIANFWKTNVGEQNKLEIVKKTETEAFEQFQLAQQTRKDADKKSKQNEKFPLLLKAEENEKLALQKLQKVLFTYLNYPAQYNTSWFSESSIAEKKEPEKSIVGAPSSNIANNTTTKTSLPVSTPTTIVTTPKETVTESNAQGEQSLYSMVDVNEAQIDAFNKFIQNKYPDDYEKYIIDFSKIDYSDLQSIKNSWYQYRYGQMEDTTYYLASQEKNNVASDTAQELIGQELIAADTKIPANNQKTLPDNVSTVKSTTDNKTIAISQTQKPKSDNNDKLQQSKTEIPVEVAATEPNKNSKANKGTNTETTLVENTSTKTINQSTSNITSEPIAHGFLFKVQIAASRVVLDPTVISGIYSGDETINQTYEEDWYKYTIGEYNTYRNARAIREKISIPGAFVVAYLNGKRIKITPAVARNQQNEAPLPDNIQPQNIQFRVQIAASKNELSSDVLKNIYNGNLEIISILEDGWYKYSLYAGNKLDDALELLKTINIPGAFVVTYYNNEKINLRSAIQLTKFN